jgi:hypothetical protein
VPLSAISHYSRFFFLSLVKEEKMNAAILGLTALPVLPDLLSIFGLGPGRQQQPPPPAPGMDPTMLIVLAGGAVVLLVVVMKKKS